MIIAKTTEGHRYDCVHPRLKALFDYIEQHDLREVPAGRITIDGDNLFINVSDATLKTKDAQKLEVHRKYIDVHFPLSGNEIIGIRHLDTLDESDAPFDEENDFALYTAAADNYIVLHPGEFCLVYPEEAHAPIIGTGKLRKLIAKVLI